MQGSWVEKQGSAWLLLLPQGVSMALDADQLAQLRRMVADTTGQTWSDDLLQAAAEAFLVDGAYNLRATAASLWEEKAAEWATLVRTSESGSSRDAQQQFDHAMALAKRFKEDGSSETGITPIYPRSTRIVRPTRGA